MLELSRDPFHHSLMITDYPFLPYFHTCQEIDGSFDPDSTLASVSSRVRWYLLFLYPNDVSNVTSIVTLLVTPPVYSCLHQSPLSLRLRQAITPVSNREAGAGLIMRGRLSLSSRPESKRRISRLNRAARIKQESDS